MKKLMTEVPTRMRSRPKDARGIPIPFTVQVDKNRRPHFEITADDKMHACIWKRLCAMCGRRLDAGSWFVGGPGSFLHEDGAFTDPAMHYDCARFALAVCPYLAAPRYSKLIDGKRFVPDVRPEGITLALNQAVSDTRPPLFMLGRSNGFRPVTIATGQTIIIAGRPWDEFQFWEAGQQLDDEAGWTRAEAHAATVKPR